jgi:hypothetical protein
MRSCIWGFSLRNRRLRPPPAFPLALASAVCSAVLRTGTSSGQACVGAEMGWNESLGVKLYSRALVCRRGTAGEHRRHSTRADRGRDGDPRPAGNRGFARRRRADAQPPTSQPQLRSADGGAGERRRGRADGSRRHDDSASDRTFMLLQPAVPGRIGGVDYPRPCRGARSWVLRREWIPESLVC